MKYWNQFWDNPVALRRMNGWVTVGWATQIVLVLVFPQFQRSLAYLVVISIAAALIGQLSNWQAARVEVRQSQYEARIEALLEALSAANHLGEVEIPPDPEGAQNGS